METLKNAKSELATANKEILSFINSFVDSQSFIQTDEFIHSDNFEKAPGEGVVCGFATIDYARVCLFATNPSILKGSIGSVNAKKIVKTINNAVRTGTPLIAVWDTSGARIGEGIDCLEGYSDILRAFSIAYGEVPIISIVKGKNLGISSYVTGVSDFVIAYPDSTMATASPLVLSAKLGVDEKIVGSAKELAQNGIVTNIVKGNELSDTLKDILDLVYNEKTSDTDDDFNRVCKGLKRGVSVNTVIKETIDKDTFFALRSDFATEAITGLAVLGGTTVGIVATDSSKNDGRLSADGCVKIDEFLNLCENIECPIVFITDCAGTELGGNDYRLIREASNLAYHINSLQVDMFSVVIGKAIGAAYTMFVAPCEYKIAWECAEVAAIESESAARLLYADEIKSAKDKDKVAKKLAESYAEENSSALCVARNGYFDNVIEPNHTRVHLIAALLAHVE